MFFLNIAINKTKKTCNLLFFVFFLKKKTIFFFNSCEVHKKNVITIERISFTFLCEKNVIHYNDLC